MADKPTLADYIDLAIEAEGKARDFYKALAGKFPEPHEVSEFWLEMMREEEEHLNWVRYIRGNMPPGRLGEIRDNAAYGNLKEFLEREVEGKLDSIRTLDDAYLMAYNLEFSEVNGVMEFLVSFYASAAAQQEAINSLERHIEKVKEFSDRFGDATWRKSIKAR